MNDIRVFTDEEDFRASRARSLGSSDIPVLTGLTVKYGRTPLLLWQEKTGRRDPFAGNERTWWGHMHEQSILYRYIMDHYSEGLADRYLIGKIQGQSTDSLLSNTEARHPEYPYMVSHADLLIAETEHIQEAKSAGFFGARRSDDSDYGYNPDDDTLNGVPLSVYLQVQHQMLCYGAHSAGVSLLADTAEYAEFGPGQPDVTTQEKILALAERFWWHVEHDEPPKPETWQDVISIWPTAQDTAATYPLEYQLDDRHTLLDMLRERERLAARQKADKARLNEIKNAVGILVNENRVLQTPEGYTLATTYTTERENISTKQLREYYPDFYARLVADGIITTSESRQLKFRTLKLN